MSKFIVPVQLSDFLESPTNTFAQGFVGMYVKNGWLKLKKSDLEKDAVLDRPLNGFEAETEVFDVLPEDSVLRAIEKLAARTSGGGGVSKGVMVYGTTVSNNNSLTVNADWQWVVETNTVSLQNPVTLVFPGVAENQMRIDTVVGNTSGNVSRVQGISVSKDMPVVPPNIPSGWVPLFDVSVFDLEGRTVYFGSDGIDITGDDVTLGGFVMNATTDFKYNLDSWPQEAKDAVIGTLDMFRLLKVIPVLGNKLLLQFSRHVVIVEQDGSVYSPNGKPWIYLITVANITHLDIDFERNAVFIGTSTRFRNFEHFEVDAFGEWTKTLLGSYWVIKIDLTTGLHIPEFVFSQSGTYNGTPSIYKLSVMKTGNIFFQGSHYTYDEGEANGFYRFVINGVTGAYIYSNTLSSSNLGGNGGNFFIDGYGAATIPNLDQKVDSQNRVYEGWAIGQATIDGQRGVMRYNMDVQTAFFPNYRIDETFNLPLTRNPAYTSDPGATSNGIRFVEILEDDSIIIIRHAINNLVLYDGEPMPVAMKFNEFGVRDLTFGQSLDGEIGLYNFSLATITGYHKVKTNLYQLNGSFTFNTDFGSVSRNVVFINSNGRLVKNFEGFTANNQEITSRFRYENSSGVTSPSTANMMYFLHPYLETLVIGSLYRYTTDRLVFWTSPTKIEYVDIYQSYSFFRFGVRRNDSTGQHLIGYETYQGYKFTDNSFITKNFVELKSKEDRLFSENLTNILSSNIDLNLNQKFEESKSYADGLFETLTGEPEPQYKTCGINIDGAGNPISTGLKGYGVIPFNCKVVSWYIVGDAIGNFEIDVWVSSSIPNNSNSITALSKPKLDNQQVASSGILTGWNQNIFSGNIIAYSVLSSSIVTKINLVLKLELV
jgi:hypothetical protein